jgi:hypothetical protein
MHFSQYDEGSTGGYEQLSLAESCAGLSVAPVYTFAKNALADSE